MCRMVCPVKCSLLMFTVHVWGYDIKMHVPRLCCKGPCALCLSTADKPGACLSATCSLGVSATSDQQVCVEGGGAKRALLMSHDTVDRLSLCVLVAMSCRGCNPLSSNRHVLLVCIGSLMDFLLVPNKWSFL